MSRSQDIRNVIAEAATRRANAAKGCASGTERSRGIVEETAKNGFRTKADEEDAEEEAIMQAYIDMIQKEEREKYGDSYVPASHENPAGSQGAVASAAAAAGEKSPAQKIPSKPPPLPPSPPPIPASTKPSPLIDLTRDDSWACPICTLINPSTYLCCDACSIQRPDPTFHPPSSSSSIQPPTSSSCNRKPPTPTPTTRIPSKTTTTTTTPNSRKPPTNNSKPPKKSSIQALIALENVAKSRAPEPLGWLCHQCGNFTENEWRSCVRCGGMRAFS